MIPDYIERAQSLADERGLPCAFHCADAREFVPAEPCDAAFNWFTSFAYGEDDADNARMLERARRSLKPGGRFLLEIINVPRILGEFQPGQVSRHDTPDGELIVTIENTIDFARGMIDGTWTFVRPDGSRKEREIHTRLIMPHEIVRMLRASGFEQIDLLDWPGGGPFTLRSRRLVVTARARA